MIVTATNGEGSVSATTAMTADDPRMLATGAAPNAVGVEIATAVAATYRSDIKAGTVQSDTTDGEESQGGQIYLPLVWW